MSLGYSRRSPLQHIIHVPSGVKFQKSLSELSFQTPNPQRSKTLNCKTSVKMERSSPTKSKTSILKPRWKTIQFPPIPQRFVLKLEDSPASYLTNQTTTSNNSSEDWHTTQTLENIPTGQVFSPQSYFPADRRFSFSFLR